MPNFDVTTGLTAGINAADSFAGGYQGQENIKAQQALQQQHLKAQQDAQKAEQDYHNRTAQLEQDRLEASIKNMGSEMENRTGELQARNKEIAQQGEYQRGELQQHKDEIAYKQGGDLEAGDATLKIAGMLGQEPGADVEKSIQETHDNVHQFLGTLSPAAQKFAIPHAATMLAADDKQMRDAGARRGMIDAWTKALHPDPTTGLAPLIDPNDHEDPQGQQIQTIAQQKIQSLHDGSITPHEAETDLDAAQNRVRKIRQAAGERQSGLTYLQQLQQSMGSTGIRLNDVIAEAMSNPEMTGKEIMLAGFKRAHGLDAATIKLGDNDIPANLAPGSDQWKSALNHAADAETVKMLGQDPWVKNEMSSGKMTEDKYKKARDEMKDSVLAGYGARWGLTADETKKTFAPTPKAKGQAELDKAEKAGINLDTPIPRPGAAKPAGKVMGKGEKNRKDLSKLPGVGADEETAEATPDDESKE